MTALSLCFALLSTYPNANGVRACRLVPWAIEGAAEARTWTRESVTPALMMGIAAVETGGTFKPWLVNGGGYCGPFQVHPRNTRHSLTCAELMGQPGAMASGRILGRFARRGGGLREALRLYSGSAGDNFVYSARVIALAGRW